MAKTATPIKFVPCKFTNDDMRLVTEAVNVGIDAHLEGFVESRFCPASMLPAIHHSDGSLRGYMGPCLIAEIHPWELHILVRRLGDMGDVRAVQLAEDLVEVCREDMATAILDLKEIGDRVHMDRARFIREVLDDYPE